ncbi:helix-turn-helix domain-containing protein [Spirosoma utsteinense]|uniref:AraC-like DNA-binding protein n=1 Tax=Spirosoma utsteinense TaxID=2585773 RepID=A0ABR6W3F0_9BACT|nr:helix-turn-helix domain-containing protein [Spirosoma utsteinense]MBC3789054.1 AraC-like DNA-binding protein [Spirosoma utsteinense]MBC3791109.1 AraC-like DNA-binding protein [Spirosoma utsteinense]
MAHTKPQRFKTISEFHHFRGLPRPEHPLISLVNAEDIKHSGSRVPTAMVFDFYSIALKKNFNAKVKYGQTTYDFDEGVLTFMSPGQLLSVELEEGKELEQSGWLLFIHPDFLWGTPLAKKIKNYAFFEYTVHEALFLSDKEEAVIRSIIGLIDQEYRSNIDKFSQELIASQLETLLTYAERFYERQFVTRKIQGHQLLDRFEEILTANFKSDRLMEKGLPAVGDLASALNISSNYLSSLLRTLTGLNAQQHIHNRLIEIAKEKLSTTDLSVSEVAYSLGFEHPQSFSKFFKTKTHLSPLAFRQSFN